jgi:phosphonate transport system substrate-binding protein
MSAVQRRSPWRITAFVVVTVSAVVTLACGSRPLNARPERVRVGLIAPLDDRVPVGEQVTRTRNRLAPVAAYLETVLHLPVTIDGMRDLDPLAAGLETGTVDVAFLGAAHFAHAHERTGALPLVVRESDRYVTAVFIAAADDARATLNDFRGGLLSFSPRFSSSHIMARHYLEQQGIAPEQFFRAVEYSPNSDNTALLVTTGRADLVATGGAAVAQMIQNGGLRANQIKVVWETPPYVTSVIAASPQLPEPLLIDIRNAFLALSIADRSHAPVLSALNATAFLPASLDDYADVTALMRRMRLLDTDLAGDGGQP